MFSMGDQALLVDNGFSRRELFARLEIAGINPAAIIALFVTHDHIDHIRGVFSASRKLKIPVYLPEMMAPMFAERYPHARITGVAAGMQVRIGSFMVHAMSAYHDATASLCYTIEAGGLRITIITDTGRTDEIMERSAEESNLLFLEANYCPDMLENGRYPLYLKRRIAGDRGHLSNDAASTLFNRAAGQGRLSHVYFCHLSQENNDPQVLEEHILSTNCPLCRYTVCERGKQYTGMLLCEE